MLAKFFLVPFALVCSGALAEDSVFPESAQQVLQEYSAAFNRYDCEAMLELASPVLMRQLDRTADGRSEFCQSVELVKSNSFSETVGELVDFRSEGPYRLAVFRATRTPGPESTAFGVLDHAYFLHSSDSGETWSVLDLSCTDSSWVRMIFPPFDGSPPIVVQGVLSID